MSPLSDADRGLVEALPFDGQAAPAFNEMTWCLVWPDEVPDGLSREGYRIVRDLLVARGFIHRGVPVEAWDEGYLDRWEAWNEALSSRLRWNGFRRIALTTAQRTELRRHLTDDSEA